MRVVEKEETIKRGCEFCTEAKKFVGKYRFDNGTYKYMKTHYRCPYNECQAYELDQYNTYEEFLDNFSNELIMTN